MITPSWLPETPIIVDTRRMVRQLGIVQKLLTHQRICFSQPSEAYELIEECLILLGVTNRELVENLKGSDT